MTDYTEIGTLIAALVAVYLSFRNSRKADAAKDKAVIAVEAANAAKVAAENSQREVIATKDADGKPGTIVGVHMVGPLVTEQLGQGYLAVNWEATVDEVAAFIQPHPTLSELFGDTVQDMTGRRLH